MASQCPSHQASNCPSPVLLDKLTKWRLSRPQNTILNRFRSTTRRLRRMLHREDRCHLFECHPYPSKIGPADRSKMALTILRQKALQEADSQDGGKSDYLRVWQRILRGGCLTTGVIGKMPGIIEWFRQRCICILQSRTPIFARDGPLRDVSSGTRHNDQILTKYSILPALAFSLDM